MKSPHEEYWRQTLEVEYQNCIREQRNVDGITTVMDRVGFTSDDLRQLYLRASITMTDAPEDVLREVVQNLPLDSSCNQPVIL